MITWIRAAQPPAAVVHRGTSCASPSLRIPRPIVAQGSQQPSQWKEPTAPTLHGFHRNRRSRRWTSVTFRPAGRVGCCSLRGAPW